MANNCLDINKPFKRVGQFAPFENEIFESEDAAKIYALSGKFGGTAVPGLLVRVYDENTRAYKVYTITKDYTLRLVSSDAESSGGSEVEIEHNCGETSLYNLEAGTVISQLSLVILEEFNSNNPFTIEIVPFDNVNNVTKLIKTYDNPAEGYEFICTADEADDEFFYKVNIKIETASILRIVGNINPSQLGADSPTGKLKLVLN